MDSNTAKFDLSGDRTADVHALMSYVLSALKEKGYNPINQIVGEAAHLSATAPIGATPEEGLAYMASSAIAYAQRPVYKSLDRHIDGIVDSTNLITGKFAGHHELRESACGQESRFRGRANVALRAGVEGNGRNIHHQHRHILHYQRIDSYGVKLGDELPHRFKLVVVNNSIDCSINFRAEEMRVLYEALDVGERVAGFSPGAESRRADIHGIGTAVDGGDAYVGRLGR